MWLERHFVRLYRLDYPLLYFMQALRLPVEFQAMRPLPVAEGTPRLLYVSTAPHGLVGYFFEGEIQSGADIGQADGPWPADIRDWRTEGELEHDSQRAVYLMTKTPF